MSTPPQDATANNTSGVQQVGHTRVDSGGAFHASLWSGSAASWIDLHPAGASESVAWGVGGGQQAGSAKFGGEFHAGVWSGSAASWVDLQPPGATASGIVGSFGGEHAGWATISGVNRAGLWSGRPPAFADLHAFLGPEYSNSYGQGVWSDAGATYVVGWGFNAVAARDEALLWVRLHCYPDCDTSTGPGVLDIFDFLCFQNAFAASGPYACGCDTSTGQGVCDIFDFLCFQNAFAAGCP